MDPWFARVVVHFSKPHWTLCEGRVRVFIQIVHLDNQWSEMNQMAK